MFSFSPSTLEYWVSRLVLAILRKTANSTQRTVRCTFFSSTLFSGFPAIRKVLRYNLKKGHGLFSPPPLLGDLNKVASQLSCKSLEQMRSNYSGFRSLKGATQIRSDHNKTLILDGTKYQLQLLLTLLLVGPCIKVPEVTEVKCWLWNLGPQWVYVKIAVLSVNQWSGRLVADARALTLLIFAWG
jgi:hypothetical protein